MRPTQTILFSLNVSQFFSIFLGNEIYAWYKFCPGR